MSDDPASWQPDPTGKHDHRYWDGARWTDNVADAGVASTDPYDGIPEEAVSPDAPTVVTPVPADDTAAYPAAGAPDPYVPPSPSPSAPDRGSGGGSKRGLVIGGAILAAVVLAVIAFLALDDDDDPTEPLADRSTETTESTEGDEQGDGSTDSPDDGLATDGLSGDDVEDFEDELAELYQEQLGLDEEQAECLAEQIGGLVADGGEPSSDQAMSEVFSFLAECDISIEDITGGIED